MEEWRDIEGYEGLYQVSNLGNVKSLERKVWCSRGRGYYLSVPEKILDGYDYGHGYLYVQLSKDGKIKHCRINRLVAQAFLDNPSNLPEVNHKDKIRTNNRVDNLEWDTYSENLKHAYDVLHRPINIGKGKRKCKSINKLNNEIIEYESIAEASRKTGISETQIRRLINKECVNKKYEFEYV